MGEIHVFHAGHDWSGPEPFGSDGIRLGRHVGALLGRAGGAPIGRASVLAFPAKVYGDDAAPALIQATLAGWSCDGVPLTPAIMEAIDGDPDRRMDSTEVAIEVWMRAGFFGREWRAGVLAQIRKATTTPTDG